MLQVYVTALPQPPFALALPSFFVLTAPLNTHPRIPHCMCRQFGGNIKKGTYKRLAENGISSPKLTEWWRAVLAATEAADHLRSEKGGR